MTPPTTLRPDPSPRTTDVTTAPPLPARARAHPGTAPSDHPDIALPLQARDGLPRDSPDSVSPHPERGDGGDRLAADANVVRAPRRTPVAPAWLGAVMGTGIVAVAMEMVAGWTAVAVVFWAAALVVLMALLARGVAWRAALRDPATAPTLGLAPMAVMTVGAATMAAGRAVIGLDAATVVAMAAWAIGTAGGLAVAVGVPATMMVRHRLRPEDVSGAWLLPVVPPMVSAATGAGLVTRVPAGEARLDLLLVLYALFGLSLLATMLMVALVWGRLLLHGPGPAERAPALWVVLGPLGQSITAANLLGTAAPHALGAPYAATLQAFAVIYGIPVLGFALLWAAIAITLTAHHATATGVPFAASWWGYVFPTGTLVTATAQLAHHTASHALTALSILLLATLLALWTLTTTHSTRHLTAHLR